MAFQEFGAEGIPMKYGVVAGNHHINAAIYQCFEHIAESDARAFVKKFAQMSDDEEQRMHTFRELLLGGYLGSCGFNVRSELPVESKTPDWTITGAGSDLAAIVELVNFHNESRIERAMKKTQEERGIWTGWMPDNTRRLFSRLAEKASTYRDIVETRQIPYVVAVFSEFTAAVDEDELVECLMRPNYDLFSREPSLSGVLFFEEKSGRYVFSYHANPHASRPFTLPAGTFLRGAA
jgi:hypothetical protein